LCADRINTIDFLFDGCFLELFALIDGGAFCHSRHLMTDLVVKLDVLKPETSALTRQVVSDGFLLRQVLNEPFVSEFLSQYAHKGPFTPVFEAMQHEQSCKNRAPPPDPPPSPQSDKGGEGMVWFDLEKKRVQLRYTLI